MKPAAWHAQYQRRRYVATRQRAVAFLGGRCVRCGSTEGLQFDHRDPKTKACDVGAMLSKCSWARILVELVKCQLLCRDCHIDKTVADRGQQRRRDRGQQRRRVAA